MNITVAGAGYVGLSLATLLSRNNDVTLIDIDKTRVESVSQWRSPIEDIDIQKFFLAASDGRMKLGLKATLDPNDAYSHADIVIIATPTDYDAEKDSFNTSSVEEVIDSVRAYNTRAWIVIKSTVPVGYTQSISDKLSDSKITFSPEFLREGRALYDNLYPSRIIVGVDINNETALVFGREFACLLAQASDKKTENIPILICGSTEAEAIKLFANTFLAMRISFFNELDTYSSIKKLDAETIIKGVCADPRIGDFYNNPSFGYGGYCLPKDSKQLLANYKNVPQEMISATVNSNSTRKRFVAEEIMKIAHKFPDPVVGVYKLAMKEGSDNYRQSSILDVMDYISDDGIEVQVFDSSIDTDHYNGYKVVKDLDDFKKTSTVVIANRLDANLNDCIQKVYSRDLFGKDQ